MTQTLASTPHEIIAGSWVPPQDVKEHSDAPIPLDADFFAPPPAEIGKVQSAQTTLRHGKSGWATPVRFALAGTVSVAIAAGVYYFFRFDAMHPDDLVVFVAPVFAFLLAFLGIWY